MTRSRWPDAPWTVAVALALLFAPIVAGEAGAAQEDGSEEGMGEEACSDPGNVTATPTDICERPTVTAVPAFPTALAAGLAGLWAVGFFLLLSSRK